MFSESMRSILAGGSPLSLNKVSSLSIEPDGSVSDGASPPSSLSD
jgi:hypothetical protein